MQYLLKNGVRNSVLQIRFQLAIQSGEGQFLECIYSSICHSVHRTRNGGIEAIRANQEDPVSRSSRTSDPGGASSRRPEIAIYH